MNNQSAHFATNKERIKTDGNRRRSRQVTIATFFIRNDMVDSKALHSTLTQYHVGPLGLGQCRREDIHHVEGHWRLNELPSTRVLVIVQENFSSSTKELIWIHDPAGRSLRGGQIQPRRQTPTTQQWINIMRFNHKSYKTSSISKPIIFKWHHHPPSSLHYGQTTGFDGSRRKIAIIIYEQTGIRRSKWKHEKSHRIRRPFGRNALLNDLKRN